MRRRPGSAAAIHPLDMTSDEDPLRVTVGVVPRLLDDALRRALAVRGVTVVDGDADVALVARGREWPPLVPVLVLADRGDAVLRPAGWGWPLRSGRELDDLLRVLDEVMSASPRGPR